MCAQGRVSGSEWRERQCEGGSVSGSEWRGRMCEREDEWERVEEETVRERE